MWKLIVTIITVVATTAVDNVGAAVVGTVQPVDPRVKAAEQIENMKQVVQTLAHQLQQQQMFVEERIRSEGMSGFRNVRATTNYGTSDYFASTHVGSTAFALYDRYNTDRYLGQTLQLLSLSPLMYDDPPYQQMRYEIYAGHRSRIENFAYYPTTLYNITDGIPQFAQFKIRQLCHPISRDVPTEYFQVQEDLSARLSHRRTWDNIADSQFARFKLNEFGTDRSSQHTFLDTIMAEIPGKDNYGANITDTAFGLMSYDISTQGYVPLNVAHYHRWYKLQEKGAMGLQINHRGFKDENLWVAMTTQKNIMPLTIKSCRFGECYWETRRVSYALPIEIVYTTPLSNWNPYNLPHYGPDHETFKAIVTKDNRNGGLDARHAWNGTSYNSFYRTPTEFYKDEHAISQRAKGVLDRDGHVQKVMPTGPTLFTLAIEGSGRVRLRYPIAPIHYEGSTLGEELTALREMVMKMSTYTYLYEESPMSQSSAPALDEDADFHVPDSARNPPGLHGHDFTLTADEHKKLLNGTETHVITSYNLGHNHELIIQFRNNGYYIKTCDGLTHCWDYHNFHLIKMP